MVYQIDRNNQYADRNNQYADGNNQYAYYDMQTWDNVTINIAILYFKMLNIYSFIDKLDIRNWYMCH